MNLKKLITKILTRRKSYLMYVNVPSVSTGSVSAKSYAHVTSQATIPSGYTPLGVCRTKCSSYYFTVYNCSVTSAGLVTFYVCNGDSSAHSSSVGGSVLVRKT